MPHYIEDCLQVCADWGLIPTEFRQCMTWEEQVLWLTKFIKEQVIPQFNGLSDQVNALQAWFDNLDVMLSCSYHVQKMYSTNCGTHSLSIKMDEENVTGQRGLYASAVRDEVKRQYIIKVANLADEAQEISLQFKGLSRKETLDCPVTFTVLHSDDPYAENTLENPDAIVPVTSVIEPSSWYKNTLTTSIGPRTFVVFTMEY